MADEAIKHQKVVIQDAEDFFAWANPCENSQPTLSNQRYSESTCCDTSKRTVMTKNPSCYCQRCFAVDKNFKLSCDGWGKLIVSRQMGRDETLVRNNNTKKISTHVGTFLVAIYDEESYTVRIR